MPDNEEMGEIAVHKEMSEMANRAECHEMSATSWPEDVGAGLLRTG